LLVKDKEDDMIGFVHFRFTVQGEVMETMAGLPGIYVWDIHVIDEAQRKGLGKHLLVLLELIARREKMKMISIPIQLNDEVSLAWISAQRGYAPDISLKDLVGFDSDIEGFEVYAKYLEAPKPRVYEDNAPTPEKKTCTPEKITPGPSSVTVLPVPCALSSESDAVPPTAPASSSVEASFSTSVEDTRNKSGIEVAASDEDDKVAGDDDDNEDLVNKLELDEESITGVVRQLQEMYLTKHGEEATEELVTQWVAAIRDAAGDYTADDDI